MYVFCPQRITFFCTLFRRHVAQRMKFPQSMKAHTCAYKWFANRDIPTVGVLLKQHDKRTLPVLNMMYREYCYQCLRSESYKVVYIEGKMCAFTPKFHNRPCEDDLKNLTVANIFSWSALLCSVTASHLWLIVLLPLFLNSILSLQRPESMSKTILMTHIICGICERQVWCICASMAHNLKLTKTMITEEFYLLFPLWLNKF